MSLDYQHISVLGKEIIEYLKPQPNQNFVDCTLGGGGHTEKILQRTGPQGKVLAFERDQRAIEAASRRLKKYQNRLIIINQNYVHLEEEIIRHRQEIAEISGIILDLGLSSDQLDQPGRGFSFKDQGHLDMRFDPNSQKVTASDIVLTWPEDKLVKIFREYGEIRQAKKIAQGIVAWQKAPTVEKQKSNILQTSVFVSTILRILNIKPDNLKRYRIHPATQIFQSLRIAVNDELNNLKQVLPQALEVLAYRGRLAVISFHSLEDRIVKDYFKAIAKTCVCPPAAPICTCHHQAEINIINKKPLRPTAEEISVNPRSRSALLRVAEKIKHPSIP